MNNIPEILKKEYSYSDDLVTKYVGETVQGSVFWTIRPNARGGYFVDIVKDNTIVRSLDNIDAAIFLQENFPNTKY